MSTIYTDTVHIFNVRLNIFQYFQGIKIKTKADPSQQLNEKHVKFQQCDGSEQVGSSRLRLQKECDANVNTAGVGAHSS